jgi:hypothetical protein
LKIDDFLGKMNVDQVLEELFADEESNDDDFVSENDDSEEDSEDENDYSDTVHDVHSTQGRLTGICAT